MSDEAAFLSALKANPADDLTRLVYADWLDDRDESAKGRYLRAAVDLARLPGGTAEYTAAAGQLYTACLATDPDWRREAGSRFEVVLTWYDLQYKIHTIKILRELTGCGLAEAKALAESIPTAIFSWLPFELALPRLLAFQPNGRRFPINATVRPTPWPDATGQGAVFDVILCEYHPEPHSATYGIAGLLGVATDDVHDRLRNLPIVLASGLPAAGVAEFVRRVKMACNVSRALPASAIRVVPRLPTA